MLSQIPNVAAHESADARTFGHAMPRVSWELAIALRRTSSRRWHKPCSAERPLTRPPNAAPSRRLEALGKYRSNVLASSPRCADGSVCGSKSWRSKGPIAVGSARIATVDAPSARAQPPGRATTADELRPGNVDGRALTAERSVAALEQGRDRYLEAVIAHARIQERTGTFPRLKLRVRAPSPA